MAECVEYSWDSVLISQPHSSKPRRQSNYLDNCLLLTLLSCLCFTGALSAVMSMCWSGNYGINCTVCSRGNITKTVSRVCTQYWRAKSNMVNASHGHMCALFHSPYQFSTAAYKIVSTSICGHWNSTWLTHPVLHLAISNPSFFKLKKKRKREKKKN